MTRPAAPGLSFNEVEVLASKAARGSGLGWGHAEDLGRAARWLAERGLDWSGPLLRLIEGADAPARLSSTVEAADCAGSAAPGERWTMRPDGDPIYLVPLLAASIFGRSVGLAIAWPGLTIRVSPDGCASISHGSFGTVAQQGPPAIAVTRDTGTLDPALRLDGRPRPIPQAELVALSAYAARTYVPASAASRARGAGSTRSDND